VLKVRIGDRLIAQGEPVFIVAEAGVNHNGKVDLGKKLIDVARVSGADAVKFQAFKVRKVVTKYAEKADYQKQTGLKESQYEMLKKLELASEDIKKLFDYAKRRKITFLASAFDEESVDLLDHLGVCAFKVASGEITNFPLLRYIAGKKKPIILSTGMSTYEEIEEALGTLRKSGAEEIVLLHCVTSYPARIEDANLRNIETLRNKFKLPVGFSDHTLSIAVPVAAAALGAVLIEKHFTLDKNLPGPDHKASLEPDQLKEMIAAVRDVEKALGTGKRKLTRDEEKIKNLVRRSVVARVNIRRGEVITKSMLDTKRPGTGMDPRNMDLIIGRRAKRKIARDEQIAFEQLVDDAKKGFHRENKVVDQTGTGSKSKHITEWR
jgi:N-acetylneuraminate synthase/N,N'-diacetyllegionaminate synthase